MSPIHLPTFLGGGRKLLTDHNLSSGSNCGPWSHEATTLPIAPLHHPFIYLFVLMIFWLLFFCISVTLLIKQHSLLHLPWYCTSRSGCPLHFDFRSAHSSRYVFPSEPHTGPFQVMLEQSGAQMQRGLLLLFILHFFPGPQSTLSHVSKIQ